jgi:hypothetical protein
MKTRRVAPQSRIKPLTGSPSRRALPEVMDVLPWPKGYGFTGGDMWWRNVLSQSERERLNNLIGLALLDDKICDRLVTKRDPDLLSTFGLSEQAQKWLIGIEAATLKDFAQAIAAATNLPYLDASSPEAA